MYDVETGLYYLCSRYYDPDWGRFLNADSIVQNHLFSYCENNPVIFVDHYGMRSSEIDFSPLVEFLKQRKRLRDLDNFTIGELIINDTVALRERPYIDSGWRFEIDRDYATDIYVNKRIFFEGEDVPADAINHDSSRIWFEVVLVKKPGIGSSDTPINCFISAEYIYLPLGGNNSMQTIEEVNLRETPNKNKYRKAIIEEGTVVTPFFTDTSGRWYYCNTPKGLGWLDSDYLQYR